MKSSSHQHPATQSGHGQSALHITRAWWLRTSLAGIDIRSAVTLLTEGTTEQIYDSHDCELGQAENLFELHKTQLANDRNSCRSADAN